MGIGYTITYNDMHENEPPIEFGTRFGPGTNNQAEYLALIFALRAALRAGVTHATIRMDSLLIVNQVNQEWSCKDGRLKPFHEEAIGLAGMFSEFNLGHVVREFNGDADFLSRNPTDPQTLPPTIEINLKGARQRKLSRQQAAMIRWWWKTMRCRNENRLARIFNGTPSHMGRIGRGDGYTDITAKDLPRPVDAAVIAMTSDDLTVNWPAENEHEAVA